MVGGAKDHLAGTWGIGGADACGVATSEHIIFDPNGTVTTVTGGKTTAAGFWHLVQDNLDLHMVTSPASFDDPASEVDDALSGFAGQYDHFYAKALIFDAEQDSFRVVAANGQHAARRQPSPLPISEKAATSRSDPDSPP